MNIKFEKLDRVEGESQATGKVWVAYKIMGTKISDGSNWKSGNIFDNKYNADLLNKCRNIEEGEKVNVKLEQKGNFWNVVDILDYVPEDAYPAQKAGGGSSKGSSGYKWNGRTGEAYDRSAAIYLAMDIMKSTTTEANMRKLTPIELVEAVSSIADDIYKYIHDGDAVEQTPAGSEGDALEPPKV